MTNGNPLEETKLLHHRLRELDLVQDHEVELLSRLAELSFETAEGKRSAQSAYFEARDIYNGMLASAPASPVALTIASGSVGSYTISQSSDGSGAVIFASNNGGYWEHRGAAAGAIIGGVLGGPTGAALGGAIGGLVGAVVDACTGKS